MISSLRTETQRHSKVTTVGIFSGFQEFFLQPIIKDRPKNRKKHINLPPFSVSTKKFPTPVVSLCCRSFLVDIGSQSDVTLISGPMLYLVIDFRQNSDDVTSTIWMKMRVLIVLIWNGKHIKTKTVYYTYKIWILSVCVWVLSFSEATKSHRVTKFCLYA